MARPLAERLRKDGLKVWLDERVLPVASVCDRQAEGDRSQSAATAVKIEEGLEQSRVLTCLAVASKRSQTLCMSANVVGSGWAQLEAGTCVGSATCSFANR